MRNQVHDAQVVARVNSDLLALLNARARKRGMSPSELIRDAIRREVLEAA